MNRTEAREFEALVQEVSTQGFTSSAQVSNYIMANRLGHKYRNIAGVVTMESNGRTWKFKGGFSPEIYRELCARLGLCNNGSYARVVGFDSFRYRY